MCREVVEVESSSCGIPVVEIDGRLLEVAVVVNEDYFDALVMQARCDGLWNLYSWPLESYVRASYFTDFVNFAEFE